MSSNGQLKSGCGGCLIFLAGQAIILPVAYLIGSILYEWMTQKAWIKDDFGNFMIAFLVGAIVYFPLTFIVDKIGKRLTGSNTLDDVSTLSGLFRIFDIFN